MDAGSDKADVLLAGMMGTPVRVIARRRLLSGWSQTTELLTVEYSRPTRRQSIILRTSNEHALIAGSLPLDRQLDLLCQLKRAGLAVPQPLGSLGRDGANRCMLMEFIEGNRVDSWEELTAGRLSGPAGTAAVPVAMATALHAIHRSAGAVEGALAGRAWDPQAQLATIRDSFAGTGFDEMRIVDVAVRWLEDQLPFSYEPALVHGDYRLGNLLWTTEGLVGILDWEGTIVGDPAQDVAWACLQAHGRPEGSGVADVKRRFVAAYRDLDPSVTGQRVAFHQVLGYLRFMAVCTEGANLFRAGQGLMRHGTLYFQAVHFLNRLKELIVNELATA